MLSEWRRRTGAKKTLKVNSRVSSLLQVCPSLTVNYGIRVQTCAWTWFLRLPSLPALSGTTRKSFERFRKQDIGCSRCTVDRSGGYELVYAIKQAL
jgi:hypothetical protein